MGKDKELQEAAKTLKAIQEIKERLIQEVRDLDLSAAGPDGYRLDVLMSTRRRLQALEALCKREKKLIEDLPSLCSESTEE